MAEKKFLDYEGLKRFKDNVDSNLDTKLSIKNHRSTIYGSSSGDFQQQPIGFIYSETIIDAIYSPKLGATRSISNKPNDIESAIRKNVLWLCPIYGGVNTANKIRFPSNPNNLLDYYIDYGTVRKSEINNVLGLLVVPDTAHVLMSTFSSRNKKTLSETSTTATCVFDTTLSLSDYSAVVPPGVYCVASGPLFEYAEHVNSNRTKNEITVTTSRNLEWPNTSSIIGVSRIRDVAYGIAYNSSDDLVTLDVATFISRTDSDIPKFEKATHATYEHDVIDTATATKLEYGDGTYTVLVTRNKDGAFMSAHKYIHFDVANTAGTITGKTITVGAMSSNYGTVTNGNGNVTFKPVNGYSFDIYFEPFLKDHFE